MSSRLALVTTLDLPVPDADEELLLPLLPEATLTAWDDPEVAWEAFDAVVIRSTWNYIDHLPEFLAWAERVSQVSTLHNPVDIIRWNTDKRYLAALAERGLPTVPTVFAAPGEELTDDALSGSVVVKPSVGAGSQGAALFHDDLGGARAHAQSLHARGLTAMVQPYLSQVDELGETALVFLGGEFSHAARKAAILSQHMTWSTGLYADEKILPATASAAELEVAQAVMASLEPVAYARVDLLPTSEGPVVLELELTEPSLFLAMDPQAPARAAAAFRELLP